MSYQFKVGDKGKTGAGTEYEILAIDNTLEQPIVAKFKMNGKWQLGARKAGGKHYSYALHDLIPPIVTKYLNVYVRGDTSIPEAFLYDTEKEAIDAKVMNLKTSMSPPFYIKISEPVEVPMS